MLLDRYDGRCDGSPLTVEHPIPRDGQVTVPRWAPVQVHVDLLVYDLYRTHLYVERGTRSFWLCNKKQRFRFVLMEMLWRLKEFQMILYIHVLKTRNENIQDQGKDYSELTLATLGKSI